MTITAKLDQQFDSLDQISLSVESPVLLECPTQLGNLVFSVVGLDAFACQISELEYRCSGLEACRAEALRELGNRLSERLQYLLEPVAPIEFDQDLVVLQLRSNPPTQDEEKRRSYYEFLISPGTVRLLRFEKTVGTARRSIPITLTREVFGRLATDIVATAAEFA